MGISLANFPAVKPFLSTMGRVEKRHELGHRPPVVVSEDISDATTESTTLPSKNANDMFHYNAATLSEGLFFLNFLDAVSEGDGMRIIRQYKHVMLLCKADDPHSVKYVVESLYHLVLSNGLSAKEAEIIVWNSTVNNHGGRGKNIPHDLEVEPSNNYNKQAYGNLGVSLTEKAGTRISQAEKSVKGVIGKVDKLLQHFIHSGKHVQRFPVVDLNELVKKLVENAVFNYQEGRSYRHFKGFERDALANLNMSKCYTWINDHKNKFSSVSRLDKVNLQNVGLWNRQQLHDITPLI